jgi:hypothetical protein
MQCTAPVYLDVSLSEEQMLSSTRSTYLFRYRSKVVPGSTQQPSSMQLFNVILFNYPTEGDSEQTGMYYFSQK